MAKRTKSRRLLAQVLYAAVTNGYVAGYAQGRIFTGATKAVCVPGLNCYSCPGAFASCPIGALQSVISSHKFNFSFYIVGFFMIAGAVLGRFICGFLCPFGLVQDLIFKIPFIKKFKRLPGERALQKLKYVILALFVVLLPLLLVDVVGQGAPWFCKYICPSGTLFGGIPLVAVNAALQQATGALYVLKISILVMLLLLSVIVYRPFCRYLCPLGAIYGLFNPIALYRYRVDAHACTRCGTCQRACPMHIPTYKTPNSTACIRCGVCKHACPAGAIHSTWEMKKASHSQSTAS